MQPSLDKIEGHIASLTALSSTFETARAHDLADKWRMYWMAV